MRGDGRNRLGGVGEQLASEHLERLGYQVLERNYRTRLGELDIVAFDGRTLAFCEVKTRIAPPRGVSALGAVSPRKRRQVRKMATIWLRARTNRPFAAALRFDAIGVTFDRAGRLLALEHLEGAF